MPELDEKIVSYIQEMNEIPLLTFEEEKELSSIIQARLANYTSIKDIIKRKKTEKADNILSKAIEKLSSSNLRLVIKEAFKFSKTTGVDIKDLIGAGNFGLMKSVYLYDAKTHNTRFSTYAIYWIRQAMFETIHTSGIIQIPIHILNGRYRHNKLKEDGMTSDQDVMKELEIDEDQLKRIKDANISVISLDQEINDTGGTITTVGDLIADEKAVNPSENASSQDQYRYLYEALAELDDMSRDIVSAQILQDDKLQLKELGKKYGKTGERIRQIREKALKTLSKKIEYKTKFASFISK